MNITSIAPIFKSLSALNNAQNIIPWDDISDNKSTLFKIDPLACSLFYLRQTGNYGMARSTTGITQEDHDRADEIRSYYKKKYFWNNLKSKKPQSEFRTNVLRLLSEKEEWLLTERDIGLFVKLPAFYAEDQIYDALMKDLKTDKLTYKGTVESKKIQKLEFINKTFRWQGNKRVTFWFKDSNQKLYGFTTLDGHPFTPFFEEKIKCPRTFEFACGVDNIDKMWYNTINSFSIIEE